MQPKQTGVVVGGTVAGARARGGGRGRRRPLWGEVFFINKKTISFYLKKKCEVARTRAHPQHARGV